MDWKALISDLSRWGFSQPQIADECKCGQATISDLANGKTKRGPGFELGQRLVAFHKREASKAKRREGAH